MSRTAGGRTLPEAWGGRSRLPDGARWHRLAAEAATDVPTMVEACLGLRPHFASLDLPASLRTLAALAQGSHAMARLVQCDQEAVLLLAAAGADVPPEVLAAFPPEPTSVRATPLGDGRWRVDGRQRHSTHPGAVACVLVVAGTDEGPRPFLVRLDAPGAVADPLAAPRLIAPEDPNRAVTFQHAPATPVASAAWWAARPASSDGLLRDAACWFGACVWLCEAVEAASVPRSDGPSELADLVLAGRVDVWVHAARLALRSAIPSAVDAPGTAVAELAARRAIATVATTAETVVRAVARMSDPRAIGHDPDLATRVAQMQIALRRFDSEANLRAIGTLLTAGVDPGSATG